MTRPQSDVDRVLALSAQGYNALQVARITGISRSTIRPWLGSRSSGRPPRVTSCPRCNSAASLNESSYVYLLGLYLGDGCISPFPRDVWRLRIQQTSEYSDHINECAVAMRAVLPNKVLVQPRRGCVELGAYSKHWPCLFPQHGPGRKHERPIVLEPWQQDLVEQHPKLLLRGLIQSDGCRDINFAITRGKRYEYPRYSFSNASDDIRGIFTAGCDLLGVHWTQPSARVVAIARRADVAFLDTFIGPKC